MPLVWGLKMLGLREAERVYGQELTLRLCERAATVGLPVGFYGGSAEVMQRVLHNLTRSYPALNLAYTYSPPFRPLTSQEDEAVVHDIVTSRVRLLFVGLGCPKQERWMAEHKDRIPAVMVGVGAAFDFIAGTKRQAPRWMQNIGLEWLFRFAMEPRRLWKRYLYHNPRFIFHFGCQLLGVRKYNEE